MAEEKKEMAELKRILLAEDDPKSVELALIALDEYNLANEVVVVEDGEVALDYLFRRGQFTDRPDVNPAVLLLDLKMPKVDGLEVLRAIRSDDRLRFLPVVILTASREERDLIESYHLGVNAYVVKPIDFHDFVKAVSEIGLFWGIINEAPPRSVSRSRQSSR
jgi:CheY-like chemotaxis protein